MNKKTYVITNQGRANSIGHDENVMPQWRFNVQPKARYEWARSKPKKNTVPENHRELTEEEREMFEAEASGKNQAAKTFAEVKDSYIELYENGNAVYNYIFTHKKSFYEWACKYEIQDNWLLITPLFFQKNKCQVYEINNDKLRYLGEWNRDPGTKPKRDLPFSMYTNYNSVPTSGIKYTQPQRLVGATKTVTVTGFIDRGNGVTQGGTHDTPKEWTPVHGVRNNVQQSTRQNTMEVHDQKHRRSGGLLGFILTILFGRR